MRFTRLRKFALGALAAAALTSAANAAVLYTNGPFDGQNAAADIVSQAAASSFVLTGPSVVTGVNFLEWAGPGENPISVEWAILDGVPGSAAVLATGTASGGDTFLYLNSQFYGVYLINIAISPLHLTAGTYWLELQNAQVTDFGVGFWDINGGPSSAWTSTSGDVTTCSEHPSGRCSNSFEIIGTVAEPSTLGLTVTILLVGFAVLMPRARRRTAEREPRRMVQSARPEHGE